MILKIENLNKSFYKLENKSKVKKQVLKNINLEINENESIGIIGNSGSGKTTIIKILFNLEKADSGSIYFKNENILNIKGKKREEVYKNMGLVMQDPYSSLCPYMKVIDIISEPIYLHKLNKEIDNIEEYVSELLLKVHLDPKIHLNKYPSELSGGERQRVAIARSIATNPKFLVLDEPTSMIDVKSKEGVLKLLKELKEKEKISIILVSHDISTVLDNCDKVAVIKNGEIIEEKSCEEIKLIQDNEYTKELIMACYDLEKYWEYLRKKNLKDA